MSAAQRVISVWSDLKAAGGDWQGTLRGVSKWVTTRRSDGNDQMQLTVPIRTSGTDILGDFSTPALIPPGAPPVPGPEVYDASDDFTDTPPGSDEDLADHTPTTPGSNTWPAWEYPGATDRYERVASTGVVRGTADTNVFARTPFDVAHAVIRVWADVTREATAASGEQFALMMFGSNEDIGTWAGFDGIEFFAVGGGTNLCSMGMRNRLPGGSSDEGGSLSPVAWNQGTPLRIVAEYSSLTGKMRLYYATFGTGAGETLIWEYSGDVPTLLDGYLGANHQRVGFNLKTPSAGTGWNISAWGVESSGLVDPGVTPPLDLVEVIVEGKVLRVEREDDSIEEWVVGHLENDYDRDVMNVTALPMQAWITERVRLRDGNTYGATFTGGLEDALDHLLTLGNWPSWVVAGTVEVDPSLTVVYDRDNGTSGLGKLVEAANATTEIRLARQTIRPRWRRVNETQWAIDLLVSAAAGTPAIVEGKNLTRFADSNDRTRAAQVIYPLNEEGTGIANAYFLVQAVDLGTTRVTIGPWTYGPEGQLVVEDGQWVGKYLRAPDGTLYEITDSFVATQELECSAIVSGDLNVNDLVRFAESDDSNIYAVELPNRLNPKSDDDVRPWPTATNWAINSQFREINGSPLVPDGYTAEDGASGHFSIETDPQYVETGVQSLKWIATAANEALLMINMGQPTDRFIRPTNTTIHYGVVYFSTVPSLQAFPLITGTSSGFEYISSGSTSDGNRRTHYGVIVLNGNNGNTGLRMRIRTLAAATFYVDRVWMFIDGDETDDTVEGCGPAIGLYEGNRTLSDRSQGGLAYQVGIHDVYRERPTVYPDDKLAVDQVARLVVPSRGVDTEIPIAELVIDELRKHATTVTVGAIRRKLTDLV